MTSRTRFLGTVGATLACLLVWELGARWVRPGGTVPYNRAELAFASLVPELDRFGSADLAIVGSSRAREAFRVPTLVKHLNKPGEPRVTVANYALAGATATTVKLVVQHLVGATPAPKTILFGVSPRSLTDQAPLLSKAKYLAGVDDWIEGRWHAGAEANAELPRAVRNSVRAWSVLLRLRPEVMAAADAPLDESVIEGLVEIAEFPETQVTPMRGDLTEWHSHWRRNESRNYSRKRIREYLGDRYTVGWPSAHDIRALDSTAETAKSADVELVFVEIPLAPALVREMPPGVIDEFRRIATRIAKRHGLSFLTLSQIDAKLTRKDFREHSHVNNRGAIKYSKAVAKLLRKRRLSLN